MPKIPDDGQIQLRISGDPGGNSKGIFAHVQLPVADSPATREDLKPFHITRRTKGNRAAPAVRAKKPLNVIAQTA